MTDQHDGADAPVAQTLPAQLTHTVVAGDTLGGIAEAHGLTLEVCSAGTRSATPT
ncbi:hypothetical protein GCM10009584_20830 [Ornithinimicrobium humiphilum]|uniref:LysM peptidoglycan-binding domain-containing protein n=1 Tax=Ornithinimicrobium humiphilum TaxID=125288 RepID=UPI001478E253|nr:LysM domain-containing protein [Ornithinimicrobium humiphilum]